MNAQLARSLSLHMLSRFAFVLLAYMMIAATPVLAQQVADTTFNPAIARPAFPIGRGPVITIDEAHNSFHTADGRYLAFARLLRRDGFVVRSGKSPLTRSALESTRVLVIANALNAQHRDSENWFLPSSLALTTDEVNAVREWVGNGGSLLLIADHMPFPGAIENLAAAFGVFVVNGFANDSTGGDGRIVFRRVDGSLRSHAITDGRFAAERVDSVTSFTGSAFRLVAEGTPIMVLPGSTVVLVPEEAWLFSKRTPRILGAGLLQGATLTHGRGRVAIFGEAAMFTAQVQGPERRAMGMNDPSAPHNARFVLNLLRWLASDK